MTVSYTHLFEHVLEHEKHVSQLIDELVQVASEEKDNATQNFLWQFVREQVEDCLLYTSITVTFAHKLNKAVSNKLWDGLFCVCKKSGKP